MKLKTSRTGLEIAVIGMAGRFPGAEDIGAFWRQLAGGNSTISQLTDEELLAAGVHRELLAMENFVRAKGVFPGIEYFDAAFFGYTPRDASLMDPQVRALHECVYHALEDAGYIGEQVQANIGLFAGASGNFVWELGTLLETKESAASQFATIQLNDKDFVATRIAYKLNLRGPCVTVHCACSTSLYAIDLAVRQLLTGACQVAVAAGSGLNLPHKNGYVYEDGMILSPDGRCRPFSDDSNGTVEGNGMGAVVLKPLEDALRDRDRVLAVIRGTGVNNDGARKVGYTAPSVEGQAEAIRRALHMAEVEPESISYVEAHGTGTALGDPVEIEGLKKAFRTERTGFCGIGSLKSNIGHLDTAAGISSFIKTTLALQHRQIPPSINFREANPQIDLEHSPFFVVDQLRPWQQPAVSGEADTVHPLRAGVSSFGIGGTNVHVVLEEAPELPPASKGRPWKLLCLSAADDEALARMRGALAAQLDEQPVDPADLAYTLQVGRRHLKRRMAIPFQDIADLLPQLQEGGGSSAEAGEPPRVVFLLSGQGTQYPGMALDLYRDEPVFREALDRCLRLCDEQGLRQVRSLLMNAAPEAADVEAMNGTAVAQPSLFSIEYALACTLRAYGIEPQAMIGHSLGEYVAACLAGVLPLEQALPLVITRGRLMQGMAPGAMLAVACAESELKPLLTAGLELAAVNGPRHCTVAGPAEAIGALEAHLAGRGVQVKRLQTSHAFHSAAMEPMLPDLRAQLAQLDLQAPRIPYVSNLSGDWIGDDQARDPGYWCQHLRGTVRFGDGVQALLEDPRSVFVELGPGNVLSAFVKAGGAAAPTVSALRHARSDKTDTQVLVRALGELWCHGVAIDWKAYYRGELRNKVAAPAYPFARQPFPVGRGDIYKLLENTGSTAPAAAAEDEVLAPGWQAAMLPALDDSAGVRACLALVEDNTHRKALALVSGLRLLPCVRGRRFAQSRAGEFSADFTRTSDWRRLVQALRTGDGVPGLVVWLAHAGDRELVAKVQRLAMVLRSGAPGQSLRLLVHLAGTPAAQQQAAPHLDAALRSVRACWPQVDARAVLTAPRLPAGALADVLEREIYDPDTRTVLAAYEGSRRSVYRAAACSVPANAPALAGKTIALVAPAGFPAAALAPRLAELSGARVLPVAAAWQAAPEPACALALDQAALRRLLAPAQRSDLGRHGLRDFGDAHALLDEACTSLVARFIQQKLPLTQGRRFSRAELAQALQVTPRLERYVDLMLAMLVEDGVLARQEAGYEVLRAPATLRDIAELRSALRAASPLFAGNLEVLEHCVAHFGAALPETVPPISVLYPDGTNGLLERAYTGSIQELEEKVLRSVFEQLFQQMVRGARGPLRILEAGGGFGLTMRRLAPLLRGIEVEYYFTDIGRTFLHDAREFALREGHDCLTFGLFDLNKPPQEQGLPARGFDLVFAFNVVHATPSLVTSLGHMRELLKPGGLACLLERTRARRYIDLIWGLADGWWHFDDGLRTLSPLVDLPTWQQAGRAAGFADVMVYPESEQLRRQIECGIVIAQAPTPAVPQRGREDGAALLPPPPGEGWGGGAGWHLPALPQSVDGVVVLDVAPGRPTEQFDPQGERLVAVKGAPGALVQAVQDWLAPRPPAFASVWTPGTPLANLPDQLAREHAALAQDQEARRRWPRTHWSRVHLPLAWDGGDAARLPALRQMGQALQVALGGLEQAVIGAGRLALFAPAQPVAAAAMGTLPAGDVAAALENGGEEHYQALVHKLWSELFGIAHIKLDEDFFELGGDSLKVAQLTAELEKYGIKLMPNEVFNHPTVRLLACYLHANRASEHGDITSVHVLLERLREELAADAQTHTVVHEGRAVRVLYVADEALASRDVEGVLARLRLPSALEPHHLVPLSRYPAEAANADAAATWRAIGLDEADTRQCLASASHAVQTGMRALNGAISAGATAVRYALSPFQRMFLNDGNRVAFYLIDFDERLDLKLLDQALTDVVGLQGLMRSRLRRRMLRRPQWQEHAAPQALNIPLADLSGCTPALQGKLLEQLMAQENQVDFDRADGVMWRVMLVRFDRCRHTLFFNLDHSIFDNMSGQVLRRQLLSRYRQLRAGSTAPMEPVKSFRDYQAQLGRGPQGIAKEKLLDIFELADYKKARDAVEARIVERRQPQIRKLRFALDLDRYSLSDDDDSTWEVSLALLSCTLGRFLEQEAVPLKLVYQGRQYQDLSYFDTLGLFIDVLPLLVRVDRENPSTMIEGIRRKVRFVNRYNINFMNMLLNLRMALPWWDALQTMNAGKLGRRDPMILLNYVGKAEAEYQKIIEFSGKQMEGAKGHGYASLYLIVTRVDRLIQFDVFCNFEPDMEKLRGMFEEQADLLFRKQPAGQPADAGALSAAES